MKIAVCIGGNRFVSIRHAEIRLGCPRVIQVFEIISLLGFQNDPSDMMSFHHRVFNTSNRNFYIKLFAKDVAIEIKTMFLAGTQPTDSSNEECLNYFFHFHTLPV